MPLAFSLDLAFTQMCEPTKTLANASTQTQMWKLPAGSAHMIVATFFLTTSRSGAGSTRETAEAAAV